MQPGSLPAAALSLYPRSLKSSQVAEPPLQSSALRNGCRLRLEMRFRVGFARSRETQDAGAEYQDLSCLGGIRNEQLESGGSAWSMLSRLDEIPQSSSPE